MITKLTSAIFGQLRRDLKGLHRTVTCPFLHITSCRRHQRQLTDLMTRDGHDATSGTNKKDGWHRKGQFDGEISWMGETNASNSGHRSTDWRCDNGSPLIKISTSSSLHSKSPPPLASPSVHSRTQSTPSPCHAGHYNLLVLSVESVCCAFINALLLERERESIYDTLLGSSTCLVQLHLSLSKLGYLLLTDCMSETFCVCLVTAYFLGGGGSV